MVRLKARRHGFNARALFVGALALSTTVAAAADADSDAANSANASPEVLELQKAGNDSLLWGPYKPNLYFGVRPRLPKSLSAGLMWARVDDYSSVQYNFRHTCEQHEGMDGYGWTEYDARTGGRQVVHDAGNNIDFETDFVKVPGGEHGGSWGVRVRGTPRADYADPDHLKTTVVFYASMEGLGHLEVGNDEDDLGYADDVVLKGQGQGLGDFELVVTQGKGEHPPPRHPSYHERPLARSIVHSFQVPDEVLWQTKPILFNHLKQNVDSVLKKYGEGNFPPPEAVYTISNDIGMGNLHMVQKVFEGPFEFDILFSSASAEKPMTSDDLTTRLEEATTAFSKRYREILAPQAPYDTARYEEFSKSLFSNLVGGIGYFHGDARVDRSYAPEYDEDNEGFWEEAAEARARNQPKLEGPSELFTSIPSRPFFPRGFLWDEGFHLLPVVDWDVDLTLDIIKSWFNLMDEDGWIGREQILGAEARSKVPDEFQVQYPHYANPPTLFFILSAFIEKLNALPSTEKQGEQQQPLGSASDSPYQLHLQNRAVGTQYLRDLYPLLKRHYFWFRRTQAGDIKSYDRTAYSTKEGYRWRGRTPAHILTSGLDDYPRAQPPHPGELHVDLLSWVGLMTKGIRDVAAFLDESDDVTEFAKYEDAIRHNVHDLHWDEAAGVWCDASIDEYEEDVRVCHKGYVSLFPWLLGLVDRDDARLARVLDVLADPEELWSEHGIRSLSKASEFFGSGENYWRGPVWVNVNYLVLAALRDLATHPGPHAARAAELYASLRRNVVDTVFKAWEETGFAWEQYDPDSGKGQRTQHFTGWTSLVVKVLAMGEVEEVGKGGVEGGHDEL
ncbi:glycoside hydrolase family 63 protein [Aplosporella prunicola CBS 121167]|uniref:Mannosyl-oligosaccharide glucosidase n=1 Tax=Aplosporella prunicola CBS 121167 TaxID=1176127 RepID=A0A6A6B1X8_9PEZI|nr:glycoside hydrolase family 63 protein [Aplosporella prunicola CBS 121167]KAF2137265.1 glycoside hydrolase family 63 protein [Aplosporella prunicola CBS 121167]